MSIIDVIKYEGDNKTFVWKHPSEDFNTASQLIVHESQEAIFFTNGQALDSFDPGRYTLDTQNIPLLNNIINLPSGGESPFHCEVYFINLVEQLGIGWGTSSKIQFLEPTYGFPLSLGASGEMGLAVRNARKLLLKLVGTEAILSQEKLLGYFKSFLQTRIKAHLAQTIKENSLNIFELDAHLDTLSDSICTKLKPDFDPYGVELVQMMITTVVKPEDDPIYEKFKELYFRQYADIREAEIEQRVGVINQETEAKRIVIEAQAAADKRRIEGYTYQQERGFDVAEKVAANEAVGEFSNLGIGMGMMAGVSAPVGGAVGAVMSDTIAASGFMGAMAGASGAFPAGANVPPDATGQSQSVCTGTPTGGQSGLAKFCSECGYSFTGSEKFCPECGKKR